MTTPELLHLRQLMREGNYSEVMRLIQERLDSRKQERVNSYNRGDL